MPDLYPTGLFVDGEFSDAQSGRTFPSVSPLSGEVIGDLAEADGDEVDLAVGAARRCFETSGWSRSPRTRRTALLDLADLLESRREALARAITLDMGRPIAAAEAEVMSTAGCFRFYAEAIDKVFGEVAPTDADALALVTREPIGVVGVVSPWNFALLMPSWKVAPALAAGNCVVLKPAEQAPIPSLLLAELAAEAGLPAGALNVLPGYGEKAGAALGLHGDVDKLAFTGSTEVGKLFLRYASESNLKDVSLECGGKSPNVVFADAPDLDLAAREAAKAIFANQGEVCSAGSRLLVESSIAERFTEQVVDASSEWQPGDPLSPDTRMGALVDEDHLRRVLGFVDSAREEGARLVAGGNRARRETNGYFLEPTIFADVTTNMEVARQEVFGPVLSILRFGDVEEAVGIANDTPYGLAAAVWTRDLTVAHTMARALRAGTVWVNSYGQFDMSIPFGGFKQSGFGGRDKSLHALEQYTQLKSTWISLGPGGA
jgi:acyl-CoA reductase-like NAD-dependent aldehyde dehydrogenase